MSTSCLLFLNRELPDHVTIDVDGHRIKYPPKYPLEKGHEVWWDKCFVNNLPNLPKHHYSFGFPSYTVSQKSFMEQKDSSWYSETLKRARTKRKYLMKIIEECCEEPLYMELYADYILTDADFRNIVEINLNDLDFTEGNEPEEFRFEMSRFYRFVCK